MVALKGLLQRLEWKLNNSESKLAITVNREAAPVRETHPECKKFVTSGKRRAESGRVQLRRRRDALSDLRKERTVKGKKADTAAEAPADARLSRTSRQVRCSKA